MPMRAIVILLFSFFAFAQNIAAQAYQPGFRTLGISIIEPRTRIDLAIWYPATRKPKEITIPPWTFTGALNARPAEGKFPLLILSHGTPTERLAYHDLAAFMAREGFVVAAPTHSHDCMYNMDDLFTWEQLDVRMKEIRESINMLLRDKDLGPAIDAARIGMIGFGSGATTALLLGGALPDCASWGEYQRLADPGDAYMTPWARERMNGLCDRLPLKQSAADPRIKAIAAIAPGFGMLFGKDSFTCLYPPVLLVSVGQDRFNHAHLHFGRIARLLGSRAKLLDLPNADAGALLASCPAALAQELPDLCNSVTAEQRQRIHMKLDDAILAFFRHYLLMPNNLPRIPPPPELGDKPSSPPVK